MTDESPVTDAQRRKDGWTAAWQVLILVGLCCGMFWFEIGTMGRYALRDVEAAPMIAVPVLVFLLWRARRHLLLERLGRGSVLGILLILATLAMYTASSWPFNYGYPRWLAVVPCVAGSVLAVGGMRMFFSALPIVLLFLLAIPVGSRYYAFLIILPETYTLSFVGEVWNMLPGVLVEMEGPDFTWYRGDEEGTIALGEPHRGASLFIAYIQVGVFVTFYRVRPWWHIVVAAVAAGPIVLLCNFVRIALWGPMTIYGGAEPLSHAPRVVTTVFSLVLAWCLFACVLGILKKVVAPVPATSAPETGP